MPARSKSRAATRRGRIATVLLFLGTSVPAAANVTSVGSVNPVPPSVGGTFTGAWVVGDEQASNPDVRAWANINNGTTLGYGTLIIGDEEDYLGEVNVVGDFPTGPSSQLNLSASGFSSNPTAQIGLQGTGRLNISAGATMNLSNSLSDMLIGVDTTGVGYVSVTDPFSMLTLSEDLNVGEDGIGSLEVLNGALVRTTDNSTSDAITIGSSTTGIGTVLVDGPGSVLRAGSNLVVGGLGLGTLTISNQAFVDADNQTNRTVTIGSGGRLILDNGTLQSLVTNVGGYVGGSGLVRGDVVFSDDSVLEAGVGDLLRFDDDVSSNGSFTIDQGEVQFLSDFTNNSQGLEDAPGRITLENGTIQFFEPLTNDGVISSSHGNNHLHGDITNQAYIVVAGDSVATFHDPFLDSGGTVEVLPGSTALFLADMMVEAASALQLSVGVDDMMMDNSSHVSVAGEATLAGDLIVDLSDGYVPELGQSFTLLTAAGGVNGTFDDSMLPDIAGGLEFGLLYDATSVRIEVQIESTSFLDGDFNGDGSVDAADYAAWRDGLGTIYSEADYDVWREHFGETVPLGSGAGSEGASSPQTAVPEPASIMLLAQLGLWCLFSGRSRSAQL